jgi:hypothetical protein
MPKYLCFGRDKIDWQHVRDRIKAGMQAYVDDVLRGSTKDPGRLADMDADWRCADRIVHRFEMLERGETTLDNLVGQNFTWLEE